MPSSCPKCHAVLEEDEICCAQVRYTWKCKRCHKLTSGIAVPYGKCFLCGGELEVIGNRDLGDPMRFRAIREALQFELDSFHFYKLARDRASEPHHRELLERLYESELDHIHELEAKYHAHLDRDMVENSPDWLFHDLKLGDDVSIEAIYQAALQMERRTRDHFRELAQSADATEREIYLELAAEEEEHVAMLETEMEQL